MDAFADFLGKGGKFGDACAGDLYRDRKGFQVTDRLADIIDMAVCRLAKGTHFNEGGLSQLFGFRQADHVLNGLLHVGHCRIRGIAVHRTRHAVQYGDELVQDVHD
ncbi:hypothetical protein D3C87_1750020 [compost metagenome]